MRNIKKITAALLAVALLCTVLVSCAEGENSGEEEKLGTGWCEYATTRDVSDRDVAYVEMCVEGYGKVVILLDRTTAPVTVDNFLKLVNEGFYNGLTFHRIIKNFMVQGGDPRGDGSGGSPDKIYGEFSSNGHENDISHKYGVISMARSSENDSASSQFFICNADASKSLDGDYAAFGYVIMGMSVFDEITEDVFPKTRLYDYYEYYMQTGNKQYYSYWYYYGNGAVEKAADKPVIKYIRELEDYEPDFEYRDVN